MKQSISIAALACSLMPLAFAASNTATQKNTTPSIEKPASISSNAPFKDLIVRAHTSQNSASKYFLWGDADAFSASKNQFDSVMSENSSTNAGNAFAGWGSSCVSTVAFYNDYVATTSRSCTTTYATAAYMTSVIYPAGYQVLASTNQINFGRATADGTPFLVFYTPNWTYASEWIFLSNQTTN